MIFNMGAMNLQKAGKSMTIQLLFSYWHQNNCSQKKKKKNSNGNYWNLVSYDIANFQMSASPKQQSQTGSRCISFFHHQLFEL